MRQTKKTLTKREWGIVFLVWTAVIASGVVAWGKRRYVEAFCKKEVRLEKVAIPQKRTSKRGAIIQALEELAQLSIIREKGGE